MERTNEFFYTDITSVSTNTITEKPKNSDPEGRKFEEVETEAFTLIVPGDKINYKYTNTSNISQQIQGMKNLLREKKIKK